MTSVVEVKLETWAFASSGWCVFETSDDRRLMQNVQMVCSSRFSPALDCRHLLVKLEHLSDAVRRFVGGRCDDRDEKRGHHKGPKDHDEHKVKLQGKVVEGGVLRERMLGQATKDFDWS